MSLAVALFTVSSAFALDPVDTARTWVTNIRPANNSYGSPGSITGSGTSIVAVTKCGSFVGLAFRETYSGFTGATMTSLGMSNLPFAADWYDAIAAESTNGSYSLEELAGADLARGDLLVTAHGESGTVDHAMLVAGVTDVTGTRGVPAGPSGTTTKLLVGVYDSTQTPHGPTRHPTDTRYIHPDARSTMDQGIGYGEVLVYLDGTGEIVGWRWSTVDTTLNEQAGAVVDGDSLRVRPIVVGRVHGPDIDGR